MSDVETTPAETNGTTRLTLKLQHPNCWTLKVTGETAAGIVAHTVYNAPQDTVMGHFTVYADRVDEIDEFVRTARESRLTDSVSELSPRHGFDKDVSNVGNTTREIVVKYDPDNSMTDSLLGYGFVHDAPVRVDDGWEYWRVIDTDDRDGLKERLRPWKRRRAPVSSSSKSPRSRRARTTSVTSRAGSRIANGRCSTWPANATTTRGRGRIRGEPVYPVRGQVGVVLLPSNPGAQGESAVRGAGRADALRGPKPATDGEFVRLPSLRGLPNRPGIASIRTGAEHGRRIGPE